MHAVRMRKVNMHVRSFLGCIFCKTGAQQNYSYRGDQKSHPSLKTNFITLKVAGTCDTSVGEILNIPIPLNKILDSIEGRGYGAKHRNGLQNILSVVFEGHY